LYRRLDGFAGEYGVARVADHVDRLRLAWGQNARPRASVRAPQVPAADGERHVRGDGGGGYRLLLAREVLDVKPQEKARLEELVGPGGGLGVLAMHDELHLDAESVVGCARAAERRDRAPRARRGVVQLLSEREEPEPMRGHGLGDVAGVL